MSTINWGEIERNWGGIKLEVPDCVKKEYEDDDIICYPPAKELFTAFNLCHFNKVRVVIIGQDPYPGEGEADGMAFSMKELKKDSNSLYSYIIPRLKEVYGEDIHTDGGDLSNWAKQGILLLNSALSYMVPIEKQIAKLNKEKNKTTKHVNKLKTAKGRDPHLNRIQEIKDKISRLKSKNHPQDNHWKDLIIKVLQRINNINNRKICFLLWGAHAVNIFNDAVDKPNHIVLTCAHPSPKANRANFPFAKNHHFTTVDMIQKIQKKEEIDWSIPGPKK